jgi:protein SCO1/2
MKALLNFSRNLGGLTRQNHHRDPGGRLPANRFGFSIPVGPACVTVVAALLTLGVIGGCNRSPGGSGGVAPKPKAASTALTRNYKLTGVVRDVTPAASQVVIRHEAIPGVMEKMTMPFTIKDRAVFDDLRAGDEVEGTLRIDWLGDQIQDYELTGLTVTRPAPAGSSTLSLSGGKAEVRPKPRILETGDPVPDFTLTTQDGKALKLSDLRGKVVVLTFIYTRCPLPDFCPLLDRKFAALADKLRGSSALADEVRLLSVSFDPEHDTPEVLRKHAAMQGAQPPLWTFAVATHPELSKVAGSLGLVYGPTQNEILHNLSTAVIDPEGKLARLDTGASGKSWTPSDLFKTIRALTSAQSQKGE